MEIVENRFRNGLNVIRWDKIMSTKLNRIDVFLRNFDRVVKFHSKREI